MSYFFDYIRHADAIFPRGSSDDRLRFVSPTGHEQAYIFGQARQAAGERYSLALISDTIRAECTAISIQPYAGPFEVRKVPELFDPIEPTDFSLQREAAYAKLGAQSLAQYHDECLMAMVDLGQNAAAALRSATTWPPQCVNSNVLGIGHGVYTNEIILDTFMDDLSRQMKHRLLTDPPLQPCAGYRLVFDDGGNLREMLDLPPIILDA